MHHTSFNSITRLEIEIKIRERDMAMSDNIDKPLHIAMYPWFGLSHITSNLHLANKLAKRGHKVSLFLLPNAEAKLASRNNHPTLISIIPIPIPHVDGLPPVAKTANKIHKFGIKHLATAMDLTRDTIRSHLIRLKPDFVLFDSTYWLPSMARELGIKTIFYNTCYMIWLAYRLAKLRHLSTNRDPPHEFPNPCIVLRGYEERSLATMNSVVGELPIHERLDIGLEECDAIGCSTFRKMEGHYCDYVEMHYGKPVIPTGPVVPEPLASILDQRFDGWLKGFENKEVIYCALGSECILEKEQFQEIVLGLELTGRPFMAALKPPFGYETVESAFPEGFAERIIEKGIVHGGWVQQQLILKHPSVGCFITHCGSGSLSEAMVSSCQLVMLPQVLDQFVNAKLMSIEHKVGIQVGAREEDGFVTKEAICEAVSIVMEEESEVGKEVRRNLDKWRQFLSGQGLEESYVTSFIRKLRDMLA